MIKQIYKTVSLVMIMLCLGLTNCDEDKDVLVTISTKFGDIHLILFNETPEHKKNFLRLAHEKFYDSTTFHRVINGFIVQGGDPNSKPSGNDRMVGMGGPGYTVPSEIKAEFTHVRGAIAAARQADEINPERRSSGSQFYIVQPQGGTPHLDGAYTVFGQVIKGMEVVDKIAAVSINPAGKPLENIYMKISLKLMKRKEITKKFGYQYKKDEKKDTKKGA